MSDEQKVRDLPVAMVRYYAARMVKASKHWSGHAGQQAKGKRLRRAKNKVAKAQRKVNRGG